MLLCGMLEMRTRKQQLESVGKEQKDHFQLQCLMAVGSKVSMNDITPSWIFQRRKLEELFCSPSGAFWIRAFQVAPAVLCCLLQVSVTHFTLVLQRTLFYYYYFLQSAIYDNEIFYSLLSNFINSVFPAKYVVHF